MEKTYKGLTGEDFRELFDYREGRLFWKVGRYTGSASCGIGVYELLLYLFVPVAFVTTIMELMSTFGIPPSQT